MRHIFAGCEIRPLSLPSTVGSLTCFLTRNDGHLYALTAKHCTDGLSGVVMAGSDVFGSVEQVTDGNEAEWDAALIRVNDSVARRMTAENLQAVVKGFRTTLRGVATPDYNNPADQSRQTYHAGRTSELKGGTDFAAQPGFVDIAHGTGLGTVERARVTMKMRVTRPGDSGGPIFTANGELVGFVSVGIREGETRVILAAPVLALFGATLATIGNEAQWRPAAIVLKSDDESDSSDEEPVWVDPFAGNKGFTSPLFKK